MLGHKSSVGQWAEIAPAGTPRASGRLRAGMAPVIVSWCFRWLVAALKRGKKMDDF
jgi:hypothetical protein